MTFTLQKVGCMFFRQDRKKEFLLFLALRSCVLGEGTPFIFLFFPLPSLGYKNCAKEEGGRNKRKSNLFSRAVELAKHALRTLHIPPPQFGDPIFPRGIARGKKKREKKNRNLFWESPRFIPLSNRLRHASGGTRNQKSDFSIHICCRPFCITIFAYF